MKRKKVKHNCLKCENVPCVNLYRKLGKNEGGELYLYNSIIKNKLHVPCECGALIHSLCQSLSIIEDEIPTELFIQCIRDLKTAAFLILTGHYRSAMQLIRPIIENWLTGLYWQVKFSNATAKEKQQITVEYYKFLELEEYSIIENDWKEIFTNSKRKKYFNHEFLTSWLLKRGVKDGKFKSNIQKRMSYLNRYLHPNFKKTEMSRFDCFGCSSGVKYNNKEFENTIREFQDVVTYILDSIYTYLIAPPLQISKISKLKKALTMTLYLPITEKEIGKQIIFSNELQLFIKKIEKELKNY
jgi:hypothetical protein